MKIIKNYDMTSLLPLALVYLNRGWSILPVGKDKRPLILSWKEFQTRRPTHDEIVSWWTQTPDAQIGIITGEISDLTVIDVESDGDFSLVADPTYVVETGGKGRHYYFKYENAFKNAVRIFPSVDVRSQGGYVVSAGSETVKGHYRVLEDREVTQMSSSTKKAFLEANRRQIPWHVTPSETPYPQLSTEGLDYMGSSEGSRNDAMTKFAGSIHAKLHPSLWNTIGWQIFEASNLKNSPPLGLGEIRVIWESIGSRETRQNPHGRDFQDYVPSQKTWGPAPEHISSGSVTPQDARGTISEAEIAQVPSSAEKTLLEADRGQIEGDESQPDGALSVIEIEIDPKDTLHVSEVADIQKVDSDSTFPLDMPPFDDALLGGFSAGEIIVVAGQTGCLHPDTIIQDVVDGSLLTVKQRSEVGKPFHVLSYDHKDGKIVVARATAPIAYSETEMIEFCFSNGKKITVTPQHLFWNGAFYETAASVLLRLGSSDVLLPSFFDPTNATRESSDTCRDVRLGSVLVVSGAYVQSTTFYDFHVPTYNNYFLSGVLNHNCGKTSLIQDWSVTLSSGGQSNRQKLPSLWFSYEVLAKPLWQKFQVMGATVDTPIYMPRFNESGDTEWVIDVIERAIEKWGIRVVCIDHLGFLRAPRGNYSNAADAITHTVRMLKKIAVQRGLIILLPVHIRKTTARVPDLNDIKDALGIAQEADTVFFIGREKDSLGMPTSQAKVWLVKNRKTGIAVSATFDYQFNRYYYNAAASERSRDDSQGMTEEQIDTYNNF